VRIGVNLIPLRPGQMGGAEVYFRDLLAEWLGRGDHEYVLVTGDYNHGSLPEDSTRCRRVLFARDGSREAVEQAWTAQVSNRLRRGLRWLKGAYRRRVPAGVRNSLGPLVRPTVRSLEAGLGRVRDRHRQRRADSLRDLIRRERLDLWFCPFTDLEPRISPVPAVITVHDVQHEYYPEFFHPDELRHRRHFFPESCAAADHIIAVSEFTRRCVLEKYGVEPGRVSAIWEAAGSDFDWRGATAHAPAVRKRYALPARYILYPANTWHHKNHLRLIEALAHYRQAHRGEPNLVLTGVGKEGQEALDRAVEAHRLQGLVRMLGYVPRADLPALYAGAACLVFPSLFEGFGIPLVEAMLVGCPIAAADVASIPEVVGDAAVLFDPLDPADISRALATVLGDAGQAAELARRGRARAELFSVSRMATVTLELFERVAREAREHGRAGREIITVEGVYDDRWMGRESVVGLAGRSLVMVEIEGQLSELPFLLPQELVVRVEGRATQVVSITSPGPFRVHVPLPPDGESGAWEVSLVPSRTFCPLEHGLSADNRDLSVQLLSVRARTRDGREIVKTLGLAPAEEAS
jgi:glycosyltransferase involved in cell wall biosynthesis